ncbi:hypothetical protein [Schumannella sp. 10F1B-5-1]|uniref:hypothetical protein n=1 Tax=Schumannella sp. 10F1B-5-1 TaxID=2590780 RepID=UPI001131FE29|nr:hypothetical protein [Schumannella sp. 10F1B-5-1]TPW70664.1 hypothetical protein FJ658_11030 [Schumannella sp. 10F1B-5-1]
MSRSLRAPVLLVTAAAAALALVGCTPTGDDDAASTTSPSPSKTASASPSPSASASDPAGIDLDCGDLVSAGTVYDFNPNFVLLDDPDLPAGSAAAQAEADGGVGCAWQNTTSGVLIYVSAEARDADQLAALEATAGTASADYAADRGYFASSGGVGTASAVEGSVWIVASSVVFGQSLDAKIFVDSAAAAVA